LSPLQDFYQKGLWVSEPEQSHWVSAARKA
jgi:hypothetical protein